MATSPLFSCSCHVHVPVPVCLFFHPHGQLRRIEEVCSLCQCIAFVCMHTHHHPSTCIPSLSSDPLYLNSFYLAPFHLPLPPRPLLSQGRSSVTFYYCSSFAEWRSREKNRKIKNKKKGQGQSVTTTRVPLCFGTYCSHPLADVTLVLGVHDGKRKNRKRVGT